MSTSPSTLAPADIAKPARRIPWMLLAIATVVVVVAAAVSYWFIVGRFIETTDDAYVGGDVTVMAPKVNGFVTDVLVKDNQYVHANQVLIRLDSRDYDARLAQADAEVASAQAAVTELQARKSLQLATINEQSAEVKASGAELTRSAADQTRYRELVKDDAVSNQVVERADADLTKAHAAVDRSNAALVAAQRQLTVLDAQVGDAQARVATAQAAQRVAALNVEYTTIRSPIDGYIGNRTARVGLLADVGVSLLTVVPASGLWVDANFKEDQLKKMRAGDTVDVSLDASNREIHGTVESLAPATGATFSVLPAENATGNFTKIVQRVPVRIRLDVPHDMQGVLRPGLSATVEVHVDSPSNRS
ncbi:HlyD family secretion protein [Paraburkholderia megapolitana]|uniref:Membrane fusion protein, multidrug efflux system n=1 Tax=Paraburkholderia megapolitana TaxID=420953 RepID=A0A1I3ES52_9BURK|nr:HlyD family secretion protein [Paraburkholderia megapolitana]QDQ80250.1 HlyD family secretion protein [Paraburkholderia megapolitana]SFI01789.1 membrane fusion protein, multidrug efflux system [Paraburkholderia megapolitana]